MKLRILMFVFAMMFYGTLIAQTVTVQLTGTITIDSTGLPVPNHLVIIKADSNAYGFEFYTTRTTGPNGMYDCVINDVPATGAAVVFEVKTENCNGSYLVESFPASNTPVTVNFEICDGSTTNCEAEFEYTIDPVHEALVNFFDTSYPQGQITSWKWAFGDPGSGSCNTSTLQNPTHLFSYNGTFNVCLTIVTSAGCSHVRCHEIVIGNPGECQARFESAVDSSNYLRFHFYDTSNPSGMISTREWTFGDGGTSTGNDPWHTYAETGIYNVCLRITTTDSCVSEICHEIQVEEIPYSCESWFSFVPEFLTVQFAGHTNSIFPTSFTWMIGDPVMDTLTGNNPVYTFPEQGTYPVRLIAVDTAGCEDDYTYEVSVHPTCAVYGTIYADSILVDHALVELIRNDAGTMVVVESQEISETPGKYTIDGIFPGNYYIRASLLPSSVFYGQYLPTYFLHTVNWTNAQLIELGQPESPYNIELVPLLNYNSGPGTINGSIGTSTKINSGGTPVPNVEIILFNTLNEPLAFTSSAQDGTFSFTDIAFGSYLVYPEMFGKSTTPTTVILDNSTPSVNTSFTIQGNNILGTRDEATFKKAGISEVYPSPATDQISVMVNSLGKKEFTIRVFSITGQVLDEFRFTVEKGGNKLTLHVNQLPEGLYYLNISDGQGETVIRKMIIRRQ